jgi:plastocyanin
MNNILKIILNKKAILVIVLIFMIDGYFMLSLPKEAKAPPMEKVVDTQKTTSSEVIPVIEKTPKKYEVFYTINGFAPAVLNISTGDTVLFINKSGKTLSLSSSPYSTPENSPESDEKVQIENKKIHEIVFTKTGEWGYVDQLNQKMIGVIVVK